MQKQTRSITDTHKWTDAEQTGAFLTMCFMVLSSLVTPATIVAIGYLVGLHWDPAQFRKLSFNFPDPRTEGARHNNMSGHLTIWL